MDGRRQVVAACWPTEVIGRPKINKLPLLVRENINKVSETFREEWSSTVKDVKRKHPRISRCLGDESLIEDACVFQATCYGKSLGKIVVWSGHLFVLWTTSMTSNWPPNLSRRFLIEECSGKYSRKPLLPTRIMIFEDCTIARKPFVTPWCPKWLGFLLQHFSHLGFTLFNL